MERVLIVDDDPDILRLVSYNLSQAGFEPITAANGREALEAAENQHPDLIVLDLMMPDIDGIEVCRVLRSRDKFRKIPIIMLTARSEEIDRVVGFELGADDYVMKPFSPRELVLRVKSIFRRMRDSSPHEEHRDLQVGRVQLLADRRQCLVAEIPVALTAKEFSLLYEVMAAAGKVVSRDTLMDRVWGYHSDATSRTLDTHVRRLRDKLGADGACVETVRGIGYRIATPVEKT